MKKFLMNLDVYIGSFALAFMTVLAFTNVVSRYMLHMSISFTDELTSNIFVLVSLFGASIAAKKQSHLGLTVFTELMPAGLRKGVEIFGCFLSSAFCALTAYLGCRMAMQQFARGQMSQALRVPEWIYSALFPIGMTVIAISFLVSAHHIIKGTPDDDDEKIGEVM